MTACANPGCDNPLPPRARTGRPALYCSPACRTRRHRATTKAAGTVTGPVNDKITVELDHPDDSPDGRPPERVWTVRLRRRQHVVVIAEALGWPSAAALARQLDELLAPPATAARQTESHETVLPDRLTGSETNPPAQQCHPTTRSNQPSSSLHRHQHPQEAAID